MFDINKFYKLKENLQLEVKSALKGLPNSIWETYSSFANTHGGTILLGVKEDENKKLVVAGLNDNIVNKILSDFWNTINNKSKVSANIISDTNVIVHQIKESFIIEINVPQADYTLKPIYIDNDIYNGSYRRNYEGDYHCTRKEVIGMLKDQDLDADSRLLNIKVRKDTFNKETIKRYRDYLSYKKPNHHWNSISEKEFLIIVGAMRYDNENVLRPTQFGLLFFGNDYEITYTFPEYFLDYQEHMTLDADIRYTDRIVSNSGEWSGNLFDFYYRVYNKISLDLAVPFELEDNGFFRKNETPIHEAVREALVNCICNADFMYPRGIVIKRYLDRIILENPGAIRIPIEQVFKGGISIPRNGNMLKAFMLIGIGERAGSGVPSIVKAFSDKKYPKPTLKDEFNYDRTIMTLVLKISKLQNDAPLNDTVNAPVNASVNAPVNITEKRIVELISSNVHITYDELCEKLNKNRSTILRNIKKLKEKGLIERVGSDKAGYWKLR